jgi:hypothetical protein
LPTVEPISATTESKEQSHSKTDFVQLNSRMSMERIAVGVAVIALIASIVATISEINLYIKIDD